MAILNPIIYLANRGGIPRIQSTGVNVTTTNVVFTFNSNELFANNFSGLILVKIGTPIPTGTTGTLPIVFSSANGGLQPVTEYNNAAVTAAEFMGTGIYLMYYDRASSTLQFVM